MWPAARDVNGPSVDVGTGGTWHTGLYTASSFHAGGVNVVMGDGSVRFVTEQIDTGTQSTVADRVTGASPYGVWGAMGTRFGGESLSLTE